MAALGSVPCKLLPQLGWGDVPLILLCQSATLLPPCLQLAAKMAAPALVVAGADNLESLHDAFEWALQKMARPGRLSCWAAVFGPASWSQRRVGAARCAPCHSCSKCASHAVVAVMSCHILAAAQLVAAPPSAGDDVYVIHAEQLASDDDAVESRKRLVQVRGCGSGRRLS